MNKLAYPDNLMEALAAVKFSGYCNMYDWSCVLGYLSLLGYDEARLWLQQHHDRYVDLLATDFADWLDAHPHSA